MSVQIKRIYEETKESDGERVLVDRVWPRGVSKEKAALDDWDKDVAPSSELRKWFQHDPEKFQRFAQAYKQELQSNQNSSEAFEALVEKAASHTVTLLYAAKDETYNHAVLLKDWIEQRLHEK
ncbi:Uncharacterized conserved protein YeaO, DUF488 family [Alteribacillus persepolensis]|uniref:Uncharacterized conserved protein YeaO, DUF488 family n=1 Tax=Alteribacillus persepolensis TaxID=568899 RepID=A0A1G8BNC3_9BACI|nr:DUF488 domain-containing protein [Alteribacillus persepolensis]SDH34706.1 Uncharacterized conserved protein YeaO, DUF488 family [Alteribacillus persepolensis]